MTYHETLEAQAYQSLTYMGWLVIRTHGPRNRPVEPGVSDLVCMKGNRNMVLEVKTGVDKLSEKQEIFRARAFRCGVPHYEVRSFEDVMEAVTGGGPLAQPTGAHGDRMAVR